MPQLTVAFPVTNKLCPRSLWASREKEGLFTMLTSLGNNGKIHFDLRAAAEMKFWKIHYPSPVSRLSCSWLCMPQGMNPTQSQMRMFTPSRDHSSRTGD